MIKVDKGNVAVIGNHPIVMAELSTLVHELFYDVLIEHGGMSPEEAKKEITDAVEIGFMTDEQAKAKAAEQFEEVGKTVADVLSKLLMKCYYLRKG